MSSTVNVQNLLTNVFRPTFVYNTTSNVYQTKLELVNIDTISANAVTAYAANIGDSNSNLYVGIGAGNPYSGLVDSSNTSNTFVGSGAGGSTSNIQNGVFIGYLAGFGSVGSSNSISIGANTPNGGNSNIYIGCGTGISSGSNNIFIGAGINSNTLPSITSASNTLLVGSGSSTTVVGDLLNNRIGINLSNFPDTATNMTLDVNGYARIGTSNNGGLGVNMEPGIHSLQVNGTMQVSDGYGILTFDHDANGNSVTSISNTPSYASSNATLQVTGGFFSLNGTTGTMGAGATSNIGVWKKGNVIISVQDTLTSANYASQIDMVCLTSGTYTVNSMSSSAANATITASTSNIVLTNNGGAGRIYTYSITYFPTP